MTKEREKVSSFGPMETPTLANGLITEKWDKVYTKKKMGTSSQASGKMIKFQVYYQVYFYIIIKFLK